MTLVKVTYPLYLNVNYSIFFNIVTVKTSRYFKDTSKIRFIMRFYFIVHVIENIIKIFSVRL